MDVSLTPELEVMAAGQLLRRFDTAYRIHEAP